MFRFYNRFLFDASGKPNPLERCTFCISIERKRIENMISERLYGILLDSFWKILLPGLKVTIPLTVIAFSFAMVIAVVMALIQFANVKPGNML